jgi:hypothetical protein
MKRKINIRLVIIAVSIGSLGFIYTWLWARMIQIPSERNGSDFMGLYSAAKISRGYGFLFIYDIEMQENIQTSIVGYEFPPDQTSYFTHPPFIIPLVNLISNGSYTRALIWWSIILLLLNGLSVNIFLHSLPTGTFSKKEAWVFGAGTFLFWPTFSGLMNGQDTAFLLLGTTIWMVSLLDKKMFISGLGLSLTAIRPQLALMLYAPHIFRYPRVFLGAIIGAFLLILISLWLIKINGISDYIKILHVVEGSLYRLPHTRDMPTVAGFLRRNFDTIDPIFFRYTMWGIFFSAVTIISFWWRQNHSITEKHIGLLILLSIIFVPYAHYHELTLLLIPLFCLIRIFSEQRWMSSQNLSALPLVISLILLIGFAGAGEYKYLSVYIVMIALGYFLLFPEKIRRLIK